MVVLARVVANGLVLSSKSLGSVQVHPHHSVMYTKKDTAGPLLIHLHLLCSTEAAAVFAVWYILNSR